MFKNFSKTILSGVLIACAGCGPQPFSPNLEPKGQDLFFPSDRTMLGFKLYQKIEDISNTSKYTLSKSENGVNYYTVNSHKNDPRHLEFLIGMQNERVYSIESKYEYPDFKTCNESAEQIYNETKAYFPLKKQPDISGKGYTYDGMYSDYIFITACTDLLDKEKIIHSSIYTR
jgi:hypothetical protein